MRTRRGKPGSRFRVAGAAVGGAMMVALTAAVAGPASAAVRPADTVLGSGQMIIKDVQTNHCLDSNAKGSVYTSAPCNLPGYNSYQVWIWTEYQATSESGGKYTFYSLRDKATGRCLDSNAAGQLYTNPCQAPGNPYQDWYDHGYYQGDDVTYVAWSDLATTRALDSNYAGSAYTSPFQAPNNNYQLWYDYW